MLIIGSRRFYFSLPLRDPNVVMNKYHEYSKLFQNYLLIYFVKIPPTLTIDIIKDFKDVVKENLDTAVTMLSLDMTALDA